MELYFPLILDGATGTELQKRGFAGGEAAEKWVLEHPEALTEIQKGYAAAGSRIVYASTFGANRVKLEENRLFNCVEEYNEKLVDVSRKAVGPDVLVAGDLAPTGKFLAPLGDTSFDEMLEIYTEQAAALEKAGVDLFVVETMMTVPEARAAVLAVKSVSDKPVFVSFTCEQSGKTLTGTDVTAALLIFQGMGVQAFGLNCSAGPKEMLVQLQRLQKYAEVPLIAKPNAGMPEVENGKTVYRLQPEEMRDYVQKFADAGVCIFGGCCGTTGEHVKVLAEAAKTAVLRRPAPEHPELLPLASEKLPYLLPADTPIGTVLDCGADNFPELLADAEESDAPVIAVRISGAGDPETLADCQYHFSKPLCVVCEDAALLDETLKLYQGRAMYDGDLPEKELLPLVKKYGLII